MDTLDDLLNGLPQHMQNIDGVTYIMEVLEILLDGTLSRIQQVNDYRNVSVAELNGLDVLGTKVGESRQGRSDDVYREAILTAIIKNRSKGTIEDINSFARSVLGDNYVSILPNYPAGLKLNYVFSPVDNITDIIAQAVSAGVDIDASVQTQGFLCGFFAPGRTNLKTKSVFIPRG